jgi:tRNA-uridine 2-sulfurtransferase
MIAEPLAIHLERPLGRGVTPEDSFTGAAGGAACGDLIRVSLAVDRSDPEGRIVEAGFDAEGCGASIAAGSATVGLLRGTPILRAARIGAEEIAAELGGLIPAKRHAAELAADALHRALGGAIRDAVGLAPSATRTLVAMSGGVDSAVAALLVERSGAEVVGVTLELWADPENDGDRSCCSAQAVRGARALAHRQGIPHFSIDLRAEFRAGVVEHWLADYAGGRTPNPCVRCNGEVRLEAMLELARRLGSETLATGHYARVHHEEPRSVESRRASRADARSAEDADGSPREEPGSAGRGGDPLLRMAVDPVKDQSYVLSGLAPESLARMRFPLGGMHKSEVRELAEEARLAVARKPDSQDLCFLAGTRLPRFLERHGGSGGAGGDGPILDLEGRELGRHGGALAFTIGQRHGLGIGGRDPLYVLATDPRANTVTVGPRTGLLTRVLELGGVTLRRDGARVDGVRVRSRGRRIPCRLQDPPPAGRHAAVRVAFAEETERTAPGQMACLLDGELVLGYGTILA